MYPYTKELTLDEALQLKIIGLNRKIEILTYYPKDLLYSNGLLSDEAIAFIYSKNEVIKCTALDYATHILNQAAPPEGYGYAAYSVDTNSRYSQLPYLSYSTGQWQHGVQELFTAADDVNWHLFSFRLTDLARVETKTADTDWEDKYNALQADIADSEIRWREKFQEQEDLQDRLTDAQNCIAVQERHLTKLKNYIINQLLTN
jgi:hypothetical protein